MSGMLMAAALWILIIIAIALALPWVMLGVETFYGAYCDWVFDIMD